MYKKSVFVYKKVNEIISPLYSLNVEFTNSSFTSGGSRFSCSF